MKISRHWGFRATGWIAAYVLALQTLLSAFVMLPSGHAAGGFDGQAFLCLTGGNAQPGDGGDTPRAITDHCAACFLTGGALPPQPPEAHPLAYAVPGSTVARPADAPPRIAQSGKPGLPRAPPPLA